MAQRMAKRSKRQMKKRMTRSSRPRGRGVDSSQRAKRRKEALQERKEAIQERANEETEVRGKPVRRGDIFKIVGLVLFVAILALLSWLLWPYIHTLFEPGGIDIVINDVREAGPWGFLILLALQFLQIVVAFIPGEATQMAAGMLYGPWLGSLIIFVGCLLSSAFVFVVVHKLGAPFVRDMVSEKWMQKFDRFQESGKLELTVFILFLIPAMPKDVLTYLVPLTEMRMRSFMVLSNVARLPGILISAYAASGLVDGKLWQSIVILVALCIIAVVCLIFREKLMAAVAKLSHKE